MHHRALLLAVVFASASLAQAQHKEMLERLEKLQPAQQRQFDALLEMREKQPTTKFFSDKDVQTAERHAVAMTAAAPLAGAELKGIASRAVAVFGRPDISPFRIVDGNVPSYRYCPQCADKLEPMCGPKLLGDWRLGAAQVLKTYSGLVPAVVSIHARFGAEPFQIIGTGFFARAFLLTNRHVAMENGYVERFAIGQYRIAPQAQLEVAIQGVSQRIKLPATTKIRAHAERDILAFEWPSAIAAAPAGLDLSADAPKLHEEIVLLGFPKASTTGDADDRMTKVYGLCPETSKPLDLGLRLARGVVNGPIAGEFSHTANTLANNSGSPVVRASDGKVIGIHISDMAAGQSNRAVASAAIVDLLATAPP